MNLVELMRSLYETGDYFIKCGDETDVDYNDSYWGVVNDPDGKRRNLLKETVQQIEDVKYVWEYIKSLTLASNFGTFSFAFCYWFLCQCVVEGAPQARPKTTGHAGRSLLSYVKVCFLL